MIANVSVAHIIDRLPPDGAERLLADMLKYRTDGIDCRVVCLVEGGQIADEIEAMGVPVEILGRAGRFDFTVLTRLTRRLRSLQPDVVHTHLFTADFWGRLAASLAGVPVILTTLHSTNDWKKGAHRIADRMMARVSDVVVGCTSMVREQAADELGRAGGSKVVTIENGIDISRVRTLGSETVELPLTRRPTAVVVGRLHEAKGHDVLFDAIASISDEGLRPDVLLVGGGELANSLAATADRLGISSNVFFLGQQVNPHPFVRAADFVIVPSRWEGLPMSILESMAQGKAIVSTNVGGIGGVITHEQNGLLVPPVAPTELGDAIVRLANNTELRERLGAQALAYVRRHHDIKDVSARYETIYRDILRRKGRLCVT